MTRKIKDSNLRIVEKIKRTTSADLIKRIQELDPTGNSDICLTDVNGELVEIKTIAIVKDIKQEYSCIYLTHDELDRG